jgi:hypothetical protein
MYDDYKKSDWEQMGLDAMGLIPTFKAFKYGAKGDKFIDTTSKLAKQLRKANTVVNVGNLANDATKKAMGGPTPKKAAQMLKDNSAHGQPLTDAQKRYFHLLINQKNKK